MNFHDAIFRCLHIFKFTIACVIHFIALREIVVTQHDDVRPL